MKYKKKNISTHEMCAVHFLEVCGNEMRRSTQTAMKSTFDYSRN